MSYTLSFIPSVIEFRDKNYTIVLEQNKKVNQLIILKTSLILFVGLSPLQIVRWVMSWMSYG